MKISKIRKLAVGITFLFSACGGKNLETVQVPAKENSAWNKHQSVSDDGTVRVEQTKMSNEEEERTRNLYKRVNLVQLPVDARFNANVFRITDATIADYANKVFIAPKLFSYGSQQGGRLAPMTHPDGTVTISFNVAFVDGTQETISTPAADEKRVKIPDSFLIRHPDELEKTLQSLYGANNGLAPLPGCPKRILLIVGKEEYDATPSDLAKGDYCQLNVPMAVSLRVPEGLARTILEEALYTNLVDIRAVYETRVSFPVSKVEVSFDRRKVFSDLRSELGIKTAFADVDVNVAVTKVMQKQMMKVTVQGETSELLDNLIKQTTAEFFESFKPDPSNGLKECGSAVVCFHLNYASLEQESTMAISYVQSSNALTGQNYNTSTKLKPTPVIVTLGREPDCTHDCERVRNNGIPRETGLTVVNGNKITIEPLYVIKESRHGDLTPPSHTDQDVCVQSHEYCSREETCSGRLCHKIIEGLIESANSCHTVCDRHENHWTEVTNHFLGNSREETILNPVGMLNQLYDGLNLEFSWVDSKSGEKRSIQCPVGAFPREGDGKTLTVRLQNVPTCSPFTGDPNEVPMLYLVNQIQFPEEYWEGRKVRRWDGVETESPARKIYNPYVDFSGTVSIPGYSFGSSTARGSF